MRRSRWGVALSVLVTSACSSTGMLTSVAQVTADAQNVKTAQLEFYTKIRASECGSNRLVAVDKSGPVIFASDPACATPSMTDASLQARRELLDAIVLYTQALSALEGLSTSDFDNYVKSAASNFSTDAKSGKFLAAFSADFTAGSAATQSLGVIMDWIVQQYRNKKAMEMAAANKDSLNKVIDSLKKENAAEATNAGEAVNIGSQAAHHLITNPQAAARAANAFTIYAPLWVIQPLPRII